MTSLFRLKNLNNLEGQPYRYLLTYDCNKDNTTHKYDNGFVKGKVKSSLFPYMINRDTYTTNIPLLQYLYLFRIENILIFKVVQFFV